MKKKSSPELLYLQVDEAWLLDLERKHLMELLATEKTQARIEHMLKNGKPLRN